MADIAARAVLAAFDRVTGLNLLSDIQSFVPSFDGMYEGFSARAARAGTSCARRHGNRDRHDRGIEPNRAGARIYRRARTCRPARAAMVVNRVIAELPEASELASARIAPSLKKIEAQSRRLRGAQDARGSFAECSARFASGRRRADGCARPRSRAAHDRRPRGDRPQHPHRLISPVSSRDEPRASVSRARRDRAADRA